MIKGGFTFVLHSHLPYTRLAGRWPHGEETIHECAAETYIPLLDALYQLREEEVNYRVTIGITPVLTEQLSDPTVLEHLEEYLHGKIAAATADIQRFSAEEVTRRRIEWEEAERLRLEEEAARDPENALEAVTKAASEMAHNIVEEVEKTRVKGNGKPKPGDTRTVQAAAQGTDNILDPPDPRHFVAIFYRDHFTALLKSFTEKYQRDLIGAFRRLQEEGYIEIITSAATHGYLPLLQRDSNIYGQLKTGVDSYVKHYGMKPRSVWLPECAYRPAYYENDRQGHHYYKPGIEEFLDEVDLHCFFVETNTIEGGVPVGVAADEIIGPYSYIKRKYAIPHATELPETHKSTFQPYYVQREGVSVMGRNNRISMQVWSARFGYPGDKDYREFHKKDDGSGLQYWRVTGPGVDLGYKDYYNPDWINYRIKEHSDHFVGLVEQELNNYYKAEGKPGIICANYDTELFGHWWFEGVSWLREVLRKLAGSPNVELTTAAGWLEKYPPEEIIAIPESSWGKNGTHITWYNEETEWMWPHIHAAENRIERILALCGDTDNEILQYILRQITRELLLLESSDWPFLVTTVQAADYATERFNSHVARFNELCSYVEQAGGKPARLLPVALQKAKEYYELDNIFPEIDYKLFANREKLQK